MINKNILPTFAIIGAGKSGTTAVHNYLSQHPEVFMTEVKETNFFALEGEVLLTSKDSDPLQLYNYPQSITNFEDYCSLFANVDEYIIGESSPMYMYGDGVIERIKKYNPEMKMIAILRQPIDRLYSRYMHLSRENRVPSECFRDALNKNNIWWVRNDLVNEGFYYKHLKKFYDVFDENQIKVFLYDDLKHDQSKFLRDIYNFIGAHSNFCPNTDIKHNASGVVKNKFIDKLIGQNSVIKSSIKKVFPFVIKILKRSFIAQKTLSSLRNKNLDRLKLSADLKKQMTHEIYSDDILKLQTLIDRDLMHWM